MSRNTVELPSPGDERMSDDKDGMLACWAHCGSLRGKLFSGEDLRLHCVNALKMNTNNNKSNCLASSLPPVCVIVKYSSLLASLSVCLTIQRPLSLPFFLPLRLLLFLHSPLRAFDTPCTILVVLSLPLPTISKGISYFQKTQPSLDV